MTRLRKPDVATWTAGVVLTTAVTVALCVHPLWGAYIAPLILLPALVQSPGARFTFVLVGGLFVLQSASTVQKFGYLAGAALCVALAIRRNREAVAERPELQAFRAVYLGSIILGVYLLASSLIARGHGSSLTNWVRDAMPYILLCVLPPLGVDAAGRLRRVTVERFLYAASLFAPTFFMLDWLDRRGVSSLGVGRVAFASFALCAALFCYAIVRVSFTAGRMRWIVPAVFIPTALLVTGTRTTIVLGAVVVGIVGKRANFRLPLWRVVGVTAVLLAALVIIAAPLAERLTNNSAFFSERFGSVAQFLNHQASVQADASYEDRQRQYAFAREAFNSSPWTGTGPGHLYAVYPDQPTGMTFFLDTPLITPAKLGLLGLLAIGMYGIGWIVAVRRLVAARGPSPGVTAIRAYLMVSLALIPFGSILEDKGFPLALLVFITILGAEGHLSPPQVAQKKAADPRTVVRAREIIERRGVVVTHAPS